MIPDKEHGRTARRWDSVETRGEDAARRGTEKDRRKEAPHLLEPALEKGCGRWVNGTGGAIVGCGGTERVEEAREVDLKPEIQSP